MKENETVSTMLVISTGFLILHLMFDWPWAAIVSLIVGVVGVTSSYLSSKVKLLWEFIAKILSHIVPNLILCIIFFLFLTPLAILFRLNNKDPLMLSNTRKSYFLDSHKTIDKVFFEKPW